MSELQNCSEFRRLHSGTWAGALKIWFWVPVAKVVLSYYTPISNLSISGSWGSLGLFGLPDGLQIWFRAPVAKVVLFITLLLAT